MRACLILLLALAAALAGAGAADAQIKGGTPQFGVIGADDRRVLPEDKRDLRAIGRLNRASGGFCSAVLIAPREILTAAHCLWDSRHRRWLAPDMLHFLPGFRRGSYLGHARGRAIRLADTISMDDSGRPENLLDDWAVVELDLNLETGAGVRPLPLAGPEDRRRLGSGSRLARGGYSRDRPYLPVLVEPCSPLGLIRDSRVLLHDCDATFGASGSPILLSREEGYAVLGVQSAVVGRGDSLAGLAVMIERRIPPGALLRDPSRR